MSLNGLSNRAAAAAQKQPNELMATFSVNGEEVKLTPAIVRDYLVSGDKERVTFQELAMFINLCKFQHLNPWLKEVYCIKYGNEPATMVVGKEAYMKRAYTNDDYDGFIAGVVVVDNDTKEVTYRPGAIVLNNEDLIGAYAEVYKKGSNHPTHIEVSFDEYAARKKDGSLNSQWSKKPATMIRKVALVQALREAFPNTYQGMYTAEEQGLSEETLVDVPVTKNAAATPVDQPKQIEVNEAQVNEPSIGPGMDKEEFSNSFNFN